MQEDFKKVISHIKDEIKNTQYKVAVQNSTGFSARNLKYMKKFYLEYKDDELVQQLVAQVPCFYDYQVALIV